MRFLITYHKDERRVGKAVREGKTEKMGNWRSRWERKRDLDRKDPRKDHITKIFTKGTEKDYIVTKVHGVSPDNLFFKAVPIKEEPLKKKTKGKSDIVSVKDEKYCRTCGYYISTVKKGYRFRPFKFYHKKKGK